MSIIEIVTGAICTILFVLLEIYIGNNIYKEKIKIKKISNVLIIISYTVYLTMNSYIDGEVLKVILTYGILMMFYKILYEEDWEKVAMGSFLVYCITFISEIGVSIILSEISQILSQEIQQQREVMFVIINTSTIIIEYIIYKIFHEKIKEIVKISEQFKIQESIIIYLILLTTATMILNKISVIGWTVNFEFIVNAIILIVFFGILLYTLSQINKKNKIKEKYSELTTYTKINDKLLEEYRMKNHEFQNKLAIIRGMVRKENNELKEYIDTQIEKTKKHKYSWANEVKYIQLVGLKGLVNYKIMEMKSLKLKTIINISREIKEFKFTEFNAKIQDDLYSIIGVYLDNAKEASLQSKEKKVVIEMYMEEEDMIVMIGNTYSGEINLSKIGEYNYSTKGKSRGVGLHLVKNIIKKEKRFSSTSEIRNNYFVQILRVKQL